jgi:CubicO group peptidase (beta-lactamase class C family)
VADERITEYDILPKAEWQGAPCFPDWFGYTDTSLAMNSSYGFKFYSGQGEIFIVPDEKVLSFELFVNLRRIDTAKIKGGRVWKVDISDMTVDGMNSLVLCNIRPRTLTKAVSVYIPYPEVIGGSVEGSGISRRSLDIISDIIESDVRHGFPAAQLAVIRKGRLIYKNAWGKLSAYDQDGTPNKASGPVTNDTLFDLASNTKMYATNYAVQYLVSRGKLNIDAKVTDYIGETFVDSTIDVRYSGLDRPPLETIKDWKRNLTVRDLLCHQAGFAPDPQYDNVNYDQTMQRVNPIVRNVLFSGSDGTEETRHRTFEFICKTPLMYEPRTKTVYSDVDYMLLGFIVEKITGCGLQTFLKKTFWDPMGLKRITFNPLKNGFRPEDCAATELNGNTRDGAVVFDGVRTYLLQGEVHDEKAFCAMGGVSGHAGLFASATELAKLASLMLTGGYGRHRFFSETVLDFFKAPKNSSDDMWGIGWQRQGKCRKPFYYGTFASRDTIGHQGWTGTLTMIDPEKELVIAYLTNKINSSVTDPEHDPSTFDGGYYTASTLGFVPEWVEFGIDGIEDCEGARNALLADMFNERLKLMKRFNIQPDESHPFVKGTYALLEVVKKYAPEYFSNMSM